MRKPIFLVAGDQASIPGVNCVLSPKQLWIFFVCQQKFSEKHTFFFDRLKRWLVVQILEVTVYQENAEHIRLITFHWQSEKVERGGTCLGEQKSIQQKVVFNSCKLCCYTEIGDHIDLPFGFPINNIISQRTPLQGIVSRDFPIFEGIKKFYYRHSAKKCIKYSFDTRAHLKTERRLCFPTSNRLETWLLSSEPTWSRQYHESTMVWRKLPS